MFLLALTVVGDETIVVVCVGLLVGVCSCWCSVDTSTTRTRTRTCTCTYTPTCTCTAATATTTNWRVMVTGASPKCYKRISVLALVFYARY